MKLKSSRLYSILLAGVATSLTLSAIAPARSENLQHVQTLISTKKCPRCELNNAGLTLANLGGANLQGANLSGANLSRANLQGADLRDANLAGASLFGANLSGAKLDGANLSMADLRTAYLLGASVENVLLENAMLQGSVGLANTAGTPEEFYQWAMEDGARHNYASAIENFSQALMRKPDFAHAFLGRAVARFQVGDRAGAIADSKQAETLFTTQGNENGVKVSSLFVKELETPVKKPQGPTFGQQLLNVVGGLLQVILLK